ncbi:MAG: hypothetical protein IKM91_07560, partial [Candidatus Methanomethylophilaceae archaeon]|nr:hypothetical protein [Candidatus Methanomethylophilaceae archaeon]
TGFGGTGIIDPIFLRLPLSGEERPSWDLRELGRLDMNILENEVFEDALVEECIRNVSDRQFIVVAKKG